MHQTDNGVAVHKTDNGVAVHKTDNGRELTLATLAFAVSFAVWGIILGVIKNTTGSYVLGFILLSAFCFLCLFLNFRILHGGKTNPIV